MNARQLTRTGLVLLGAYLVAGSISLMAGMLATETLNTETGFDWATLWSAGAFVVPSMCVPGVVLIVCSNWLARLVDPADAEIAAASGTSLRVGLVLVGVWFVTEGLVQAASSTLFYVDFGERFVRAASAWEVVLAALPGLAGILLGGCLVMLARRLGDRWAPKGRDPLRLGLILLGTYLATGGLIEIVANLVVGGWDLLWASQRVRFFQGVARCVLGALLLLGPWGLRVMELDRDG
jgi:hypothetical protein